MALPKVFVTPIKLPASTTAQAPLKIPHGTAPSSPVDGDVWTTTAGIYVRVNGTTVGPLAAGGGGGDTYLGQVQTFTRQHSFIPTSTEVALIARNVAGASAAVQIQSSGGTVTSQLTGSGAAWYGSTGATAGAFTITTSSTPGLQLAPADATSGSQSVDGGAVELVTNRWTGSASSAEIVTLKALRQSSTAGTHYLNVDRPIKLLRAAGTMPITIGLEKPYNLSGTLDENSIAFHGDGTNERGWITGRDDGGVNIVSQVSANTPLINLAMNTSGIAAWMNFSALYNVYFQNGFGGRYVWAHYQTTGPELGSQGDATSGVTTYNSYDLKLNSSRWTGSAAANDQITLRATRTGTSDNDVDLSVIDGGIYVEPGGTAAIDRVSERIARGTDSSPTARITQWVNRAKNTELAAVDQNGLVISDSVVEVYVFTRSGTLVTETGKSRIYLEGSYTLLTARAAVNTAPTGASILVDVNKNGSTIYGTQANRPTISASGFSGSGGSASGGTFSSGDYIQVDIDQVGSTIAGADLTVTLRLKRTG